MPYFAASVLGAWVSDPITYVYGRQVFVSSNMTHADQIKTHSTIFCRSLFFGGPHWLRFLYNMVASPALLLVMEFSLTVSAFRYQLLVCRLIQGIGMGAKASV